MNIGDRARFVKDLVELRDHFKQRLSVVRDSLCELQAKVDALEYDDDHEYYDAIASLEGEETAYTRACVKVDLLVEKWK